METIRRIVIRAWLLSFLIIGSIAAGDLFSPSAIDRYWVTYYDIFPHGYHLLYIDALGNVLRTANIKADAGIGGCLSKKSDSRLVQWYLGPAGPPKYVRQALIDKTKLTTLSHVRTDVLTFGPEYLQITQRPRDNFLVLRIGDFLTAFGVSATGSLNGTSWPLFRSPFRSRYSQYTDSIITGRGGVSADGRFSYFIDLTETESGTLTHRGDSWLFVQRLVLGKPQGSPILIHSLKTSGRSIWCADITNALPGQRRLVVYMVAVSRWRSSRTPVRDQVFLQVIDANTGSLIGSRIALRSYEELDVEQGLAVDPLGRFFIAGVFEPSHPGGPTGVVFQALDATGHISGAARVLSPIEAMAAGIDILQE
jgi:hypothetical protein